MQDPRTLAAELVDRITDTVHQRFNPRRGVLVPPRLTGRCWVASMQCGETVMDRVDELLDSASQEWPSELEPEVHMDLVQDGKRWQVEWVIDTTVGEGPARCAEFGDGDN